MKFSSKFAYFFPTTWWTVSPRLGRVPLFLLDADKRIVLESVVSQFCGCHNANSNGIIARVMKYYRSPRPCRLRFNRHVFLANEEMSMAIKIPSSIGATAGAVDETTARPGRCCQPALVSTTDGTGPANCKYYHVASDRRLCVCRRFPRDILGHVCPKKLPRCSWNRGCRTAGDVRRIRRWRIRSIYLAH